VTPVPTACSPRPHGGPRTPASVRGLSAPLPNGVHPSTAFHSSSHCGFCVGVRGRCNFDVDPVARFFGDVRLSSSAFSQCGLRTVDARAFDAVAIGPWASFRVPLCAGCPLLAVDLSGPCGVSQNLP
jgi:hypothetical protein